MKIKISEKEKKHFIWGRFLPLMSTPTISHGNNDPCDDPSCLPLTVKATNTANGTNTTRHLTKMEELGECPPNPHVLFRSMTQTSSTPPYRTCIIPCATGLLPSLSTGVGPWQICHYPTRHQQFLYQTSGLRWLQVI